MEKLLQENLNDAAALERLYRGDKSTFKSSIARLHAAGSTAPAVSFWYQRLNYKEKPTITSREIWGIAIICFCAGLYAKIPDMFPAMNNELFYQRNVPFIGIGSLLTYFFWTRNIALRIILPFTVVFAVACFFMHQLVPTRDTSILAFIHLPLFLWALLGYVYAGDSTEKKLDFLRYMGDLLVMTLLILLTGGLMSALTIGMFELINVNIIEWYSHYVILWGLASAPVVATFLVEKYPQMVSQVPPIIARIFTPMVLLILTVYLFTLLNSDKDPYNDRDFLLLFNVILLAVLALIFFSIAEANTSAFSRWVLFLLAAVSLVVNTVALSAIVFRISTYGFTPNRTAVLGGNTLIMAHLAWIACQLFKSLRSKEEFPKVNVILVKYLPVYVLWAMIVTFFFPVLWNFK
jgi:hypothetical protein